jgi:hypothetical protein
VARRTRAQQSLLDYNLEDLEAMLQLGAEDAKAEEDAEYEAFIQVGDLQQHRCAPGIASPYKHTTHKCPVSLWTVSGRVHQPAVLQHDALCVCSQCWRPRRSWGHCQRTRRRITTLLLILTRSWQPPPRRRPPSRSRQAAQQHCDLQLFTPVTLQGTTRLHGTRHDETVSTPAGPDAAVDVDLSDAGASDAAAQPAPSDGGAAAALWPRDRHPAG